MDKSKINNLIDNLMSIKMSDSEKETIQKNLLAFTHTYQSSQKSPYAPLVFSFHRIFSIAVIAVLVVGSISQPASAGALPGEFLYPVKIIHEEIRAVTKQSPEKKISYEIKRAEKRIQEAAELSSRDKLDDAEQVIIAQNIQKHTDKAQETIQEIKIQDPQKALELNNQLMVSLEENVQKLKDVTSKEEHLAIALTSVEEEIVSADVSAFSATMVPASDAIPVAKAVAVIEEKNILLDAIEADIKETEIVSLNVQKDIDTKEQTASNTEEKPIVKEIVSDEDLRYQQNIRILESIVLLEDKIEKINIEFNKLSITEELALEFSTLRKNISSHVAAREYSQALAALEIMLERKSDLVNKSKEQQVVEKEPIQ